MKKKGLSEDEEICLKFIQENPGVKMITLAALLKKEHRVYGLQKAATLAIAGLRRKGYVVDCPRCPHCHGAKSRSHRNVPLYAVNGHKPPEQPMLL
jgi:hypothetical protein